MNLECSNCSTRFIVKDALLLPHGRKVKCAKCQHIWFQDPPKLEESEEAPKVIQNTIPDFDEIPESVKPLAEGANLPTIKEDRDFSLLYCVYLVGYTCLALFIVSIIFRQELTNQWEPISYLYETLGLPVHVLGEEIAIEDLKITEKKFPNNRSVISFDTFLKNKFDKETWVPTLNINLYETADINTDPVKTLYYEPVFYKLLPGQSTRVKDGFVIDDLDTVKKAVVTFSPRIYKETPFDE